MRESVCVCVCVRERVRERFAITKHAFGRGERESLCRSLEARRAVKEM